MAMLSCEICGGKLIGKTGGIFECDSCGMEYDTTWAKAKIQEIKGTVKVEGPVEVKGSVKVDGVVNVESFLKRGWLRLEDTDYLKAKQSFNEALDIDAKCAEAYLGLVCVRQRVTDLNGLLLKLKHQTEEQINKLKEDSDMKKYLRFADSEEATNLCFKLDELIRIDRDNKEKAPSIILEKFKEIEPVQKMISAGYGHVVGLRSDGTVVAEGDNNYGQCDVQSWENIIAIAAGDHHTVGLKKDGTVIATGDNNYGQCDVHFWENIIAIVAGDNHTVGLKKDGTVIAVGYDLFKQCKVSAWNNIVAIVAGDNHTVGLKEDGTVVFTDDSNVKEYKIENYKDIFAISRARYSSLRCLLLNGSNFTMWYSDGSISEGDYRNIVAASNRGNRSVFLKAEGTVIYDGGIHEIKGGDEISDWKDIVAVSMGRDFVVGLKSDGTVVSTLHNVDDWKLFNNLKTVRQEFEEPKHLIAEFINRTEEVRWRATEAGKLIACGPFHTLAITTEERIKATGCNDYNQCGNKGGRIWDKIKRVWASDNHTVGLREDGSVVACGYNGDGQCDVSRFKDIADISISIYNTIGLRKDGTVIAVGGEKYDRLNVGQWRDITAVCGDESHTVGLKADGTVVAIGSNGYNECDTEEWKNVKKIIIASCSTFGLLKDGRVVYKGPKKWYANVSAWQNIVDIVPGYNHIVGLKADGTVVAAGENAYGECDVAGFNNIIAIYASKCHTVGLKADGTVVAVGLNEWGQCDVNDWSDIIAIAIGRVHTIGLKANGTLVAVGSNDYGQCNVKDWILFKNFDQREQERREIAISQLQKEKDALEDELSKLKGFFSGSRRTEIVRRLSLINEELEKLDV